MTGMSSRLATTCAVVWFGAAAGFAGPSSVASASRWMRHPRVVVVAAARGDPAAPGAHREEASWAVSDDATRRLAVLVSVPMVWGTFAPAVRLVYERPVAPPGILFSAAYYSVALASLGAAAAVARYRRPRDDAVTTSADDDDDPDASLASSSSSRGLFGASSLDRAGAELGLYLFLGNCAQVIGLETTTADAAAFLVQLTTIVVPALEAATRGSIAPRTQAACAVAFAGVAVICADDVRAGGFGANGALLGDALVVLAALFYSAHVLRLGRWAREFAPLDLALAKAKVETLCAVATVAAALGVSEVIKGVPLLRESSPTITEWAARPGAEIAAFAADAMAATAAAGRAATTVVPETAARLLPGGLASAASLVGVPADLAPLVVATVWCGAATCAYTIWAQSYGQRDVSPSRANLLYTSQPIFSALFAYLLVGEQPTTSTVVGGLLILGAVVLEIAAAVDERPRGTAAGPTSEDPVGGRDRRRWAALRRQPHGEDT